MAVPLAKSDGPIPVAQYEAITADPAGKAIGQSSIQARREPKWYITADHTGIPQTSNENGELFLGIARDTNVYPASTRNFVTVATRGLVPVATAKRGAQTDKGDSFRCKVGTGGEVARIDFNEEMRYDNAFVGTCQGTPLPEEHLTVLLHPLSKLGVKKVIKRARANNRASELAKFELTKLL